MITYFSFDNWKSIRHGELFIDPLSFIIGTNASGKSNVLDAIDFLQRLSTGSSVADCVKGTRGGQDWIILDGEKQTTLTVKADNGNYEYVYQLTLTRSDKGVSISREVLKRKNSAEKTLFETDWISPTGILVTRFYTGNRGSAKRMDLYANTSILFQAENLNVSKEVKQGAAFVLSQLRNIFILTPMPEMMRNYVPLSIELDRNGGNVAGVLTGMDEDRKAGVEKVIQTYLKDLPERDVERVWAERIGKFGTDAMLYCEEKWTDEKRLTLDARGMSDGTLRFISIIIALLTRPQQSLLVVEEIDNGLHPSRADELVEMLRELGKQNSIDVLCTTHNPVLVDSLGNEMIPFINVIKRSEADGSSTINLLEDKQDLLELVSAGTIGKGMVNDVL